VEVDGAPVGLPPLVLDDLLDRGGHPAAAVVDLVDRGLIFVGGIDQLADGQQRTLRAVWLGRVPQPGRIEREPLGLGRVEQCSATSEVS
jgi:hypothetical protein